MTNPLLVVNELKFLRRVKGKRGGRLELYSREEPQGDLGFVHLYRYEPRRGIANAQQAIRKFLLEFGDFNFSADTITLVIICSNPLGDYFFTIKNNGVIQWP